MAEILNYYSSVTQSLSPGIMLLLGLIIGGKVLLAALRLLWRGIG